MPTSNATTRNMDRLREFIAHAKGGSPIALAGVIHFVRQELPLVSPMLVCSMAEQILELRESSSLAQKNPSGPTARANNRLKRWPHSDQAGRSAANVAVDESLNFCRGNKTPLKSW